MIWNAIWILLTIGFVYLLIRGMIKMSKSHKQDRVPKTARVWPYWNSGKREFRWLSNGADNIGNDGFDYESQARHDANDHGYEVLN